MGTFDRSSWSEFEHLQTFRGSRRGHCEFYFAAARDLWAGRDPYGVVYTFGYFNYSPACAMFFMALFAYLPGSLGQGLFVLSSTVVFFQGAHALMRVMKLDTLGRNLFWLIISSELVGAILNQRLEIVVIGACLWGTAKISKNPRHFWAAFWMAAVCSWKLQMFPAIALMLLVLILFQNDFAFARNFFLCTLFWYLVPFLFKSFDFMLSVNERWLSFLRWHLEDLWPSFQHAYRFPREALGMPISFQTAQRTSAAIGASFAVYLLAWLYFRAKEAATFQRGLLIALMLGSIFACAFSPMAQSAAYILYAPALLLACQTPYRNLAVLFTSWTLVSLTYSDLVPKFWRKGIFDLAIKPYGVLFLCAFLMWKLWNEDDLKGFEKSTRKV